MRKRDDYMDIVLKGGDFTNRSEADSLIRNPEAASSFKTREAALIKKSVPTSQNPDQKPDRAGRRDAGKNLDGLRYYSASDVLAGWRAYDPHRPGFMESGSGVPMPASFTMSKPGERDSFQVDTRMLMYLHVEKFFAAIPKWNRRRGFLQNGHGGRAFIRVRLAFDVWYDSNLLMMALAQSERATMEVIEHTPMPMAEAVNRFNVGSKKSISYKAAYKAATEGRLLAWRPEGMWHTTVYLVEQWQAEDKRKKKEEKSCDKAA